MKAYLGIKYHPDNRNRETIEMVSHVLEGCGWGTVCVRRDLEKWGVVQFSAQALMAATFGAMRSCKLVVIELTEKGVGLGIEAGYAHAQGIPVVTIARVGSNISTTLSGISQQVCLYDSAEALREFFTHLRLRGCATGMMGDR